MLKQQSVSPTTTCYPKACTHCDSAELPTTFPATAENGSKLLRNYLFQRTKQQMYYQWNVRDGKETNITVARDELDSRRSVTLRLQLKSLIVYSHGKIK